MFKKIIISSIAFLFIGDLIYKNLFEKKESKISKESDIKKTEIKIEEKIEKDEKIYEKTKDLNKENDEEEYKSKIEKDDADEDDEFVGKLNKEIKIIKILYDTKSYLKYHNKIKNYLKGNFTNIDIESQEYPMDGMTKIISYTLLTSQFSFFFLVFTLKYTYKYIPFIKKEFAESLNKYSFVISPVVFAAHQILIAKFGRTHAFEVYIDNKLKYSTLKNRRLPSYKYFVGLLADIGVHK